ncbi:hypothetical protein [Ileibacterium valens]|uniref:hypothetical protein n=1 Tax=Ileibacterium valens TaxID=1862668 RepID=UPI0024B9D434|nr:hypothetical protein [Ileibacterium valens]
MKTVKTRTLLRYIKQHPRQSRWQISKTLYDNDLRRAVEELKIHDMYLYKEDSKANEFRSPDQIVYGEPLYSLNTTGASKLSEDFSVEVKFWITLAISVLALIVSIVAIYVP